MIQELPNFCAHYPTLYPAAIQPFSKAGFSGAAIFRWDTPTGAYCVRAWPPETVVSQLLYVHDLLEKAKCLPFVPRMVKTRNQLTVLTHQGRLWEIQTWMPGDADFHQVPSHEKIQAACAALAQLHRVWESASSSQGPCPGVSRRLVALANWIQLVEMAWRPDPGPDDPVAPWAHLAWTLLPTMLAAIQPQLQRWHDAPVRLQPCLCDPWHDHLLFTGAEVTGLIDYGSVKLDNPAVDLARLLGSLAGDHDALRRAGLQAYQSIRPLEVKEEWLIDMLDRSGTLLALANWLRWLYYERRRYADRAAVAARLGHLVSRVQDWKKPSKAVSIP